MRRLAGGLLAAGIVGALSLAAGAALGDSIPLSTSPVALDRADGAVRWVGRLHYLGGLDLRSSAGAFGGLSGLSVSEDGRLAAVTDRGHWFRAHIVRDGAGRLVDLVDGTLAPLRDTQGRTMEVNWRDAEALARLPGGDWLVSFEQRHRVWRYAAEPGGLQGPAVPAPIPRAAARAPGNGGLEAIVPLASGRILMLAESLRRGDGAHAGWLVGDGGGALDCRPAPGFAASRRVPSTPSPCKPCAATAAAGRRPMPRPARPADRRVSFGTGSFTIFPSPISTATPSTPPSRSGTGRSFATSPSSSAAATGTWSPPAATSPALTAYAPPCRCSRRSKPVPKPSSSNRT